MHIISAYAPTSTSSSEEYSCFLDNVTKAIGDCRSDRLAVLGDFNARHNRDSTKSPPSSTPIGPYGPTTIPQGHSDLFMNFAATENLYVMGSWFNHKKIHRDTWTHSDGISTSQIDHILVSPKVRKEVRDCRVVRSADVDSDHFLVVAPIATQRRQATQRSRYVKQASIPRVTAKLPEDQKKRIRAELAECFNPANISSQWTQTRKAIQQVIKSAVPTRRLPRQPEWISEEIIQAVKAKKNIHRLVLSSNNVETREQLRASRAHVRLLCRRAKNQYVLKQATRIEIQMANGAISEARKISAEMSRALYPSARAQRTPTDMQQWATHFQTHFSAPTNTLDNQTCTVTPFPLDMTIGQPPKLEEVQRCIADLSNNKTPGGDGISNEVLKMGGVRMAQYLHSLFLQIWSNPDTVPQEWKDSTIIPIYKKGPRRDLNNYRAISLLNTAGKVLGKLLAERLQQAAKSILPTTQRGFLEARRTTDLVFCVRRIQEAALAKKDVLACVFVDFKCAFDMVNRQTLWTILAKMGIDDKLISVVRALHTNTIGKVRVGKLESKEFKISKGVRQGCPTAPILFNLYLYGLMHSAGCLSWEGARLNDSQTFASGEFADDIVLIGSPAQVQKNLQELNAVAVADGMIISPKTECMWLTHPASPAPPLDILRDSKDSTSFVRQVSSFKYLGSFISTNGNLTPEVQYRLDRARGKAFQLNALLRNTKLTTHTKDNLVKSVLMPSLLYAVEAMPTKTVERNRFQTFINASLRRNRRITLRDKVPSVTLWQQAQIPPVELLLSYRRVKLMTHIQSRPNDDLPRLMTEPTNKNQRGRPLTTWWTSLRQDLKNLNLAESQLPVSPEILEEIHQKIKTSEVLQAFIEKKKPLSCPTCGKRYHSTKCLEKHVAAHAPTNTPIP